MNDEVHECSEDRGEEERLSPPLEMAVDAERAGWKGLMRVISLSCPLQVAEDNRTNGRRGGRKEEIRRDFLIIVPEG